MIILGKPKSLRNADLLNIHPNIKFVTPVYLPADYRPSLRRLLLEFVLNGKFLTNGERGCALAHVNVRNEILKSSYSWTLVLEDDAGLNENWLEEVCDQLPQFPRNLPPSLILLNSSHYLDMGPGAQHLVIRPSLTSSFIAHRTAIEARSHVQLDPFQIADWPCSFAQTKFWTINNIAFDLNMKSTIGARPTQRIRAAVSALIMGFMSPVFSAIAGLPLQIYMSWCVIGPIKRDLILRWRNSLRRFAIHYKYFLS